MNMASLVLPTLWAGLLIGVSFIATPAKFEARSLALPVALDVGRTTFAIWNNIEWLLLAITGPIMIFLSHDIFSIAAIGAVDILLLVQSMSLLPALNTRTSTIIAGRRLPPSSDHFLYVAFDALKLGILTAIIWKQGEYFISLATQSH